MAHDNDFEDLGYGDETRRNGDYVGLPHDQDAGTTSAADEGEAVAIDGSGNIKQAEDGDNIVGVLYTYQYYHDADTGSTIDQDRDATVKTQGTVKAKVASSVEAGNSLNTDTDGSSDAGVFSEVNGSADGPFVALQDATEDADENYYAEVLLR